ncbi:hypothetical protein Pfo_016241 [Paulownia fortunei]|nr:hypothetical protein Pfo_016241 [Paulownia fortunei]
MERLRAIADAHYRASPPAVTALAYDFFKALDADQDGRVSLHEFLSLMKHEGYTRLAGRPLCECCGILIPGTFFSCVECFDSPSDSYSLCIYCYRSKKSTHNHAGHQQFLDTFTLLETKKRSAPGRGRTTAHLNEPRTWQSTNPIMGPAQATHMHNNVSTPPSWSPQTPGPIVPAARMNRWKAALMALEIGLSVGSISTTLCTIL